MVQAWGTRVSIAGFIILLCVGQYQSQYLSFRFTTYLLFEHDHAGSFFHLKGFVESAKQQTFCFLPRCTKQTEVLIAVSQTLLNWVACDTNWRFAAHRIRMASFPQNRLIVCLLHQNCQWFSQPVKQIEGLLPIKVEWHWLLHRNCETNWRFAAHHFLKTDWSFVWLRLLIQPVKQTEGSLPIKVQWPCFPQNRLIAASKLS